MALHCIAYNNLLYGTKNFLPFSFHKHTPTGIVFVVSSQLSSTRVAERPGGYTVQLSPCNARGEHGGTPGTGVNAGVLTHVYDSRGSPSQIIGDSKNWLSFDSIKPAHGRFCPGGEPMKIKGGLLSNQGTCITHENILSAFSGSGRPKQSALMTRTDSGPHVKRAPVQVWGQAVQRAHVQRALAPLFCHLRHTEHINIWSKPHPPGYVVLLVAASFNVIKKA